MKFFVLSILGVCLLTVQLSARPLGETGKEKPLKHFTVADTSLFTDWLHRLFVEKEAYYTPYGWHYQNIQEFAYVDTVKHVYNLKVNMTFRKNGKMKECKVEGLPAPSLNEELERVIEYYSPKWKLQRTQKHLTFYVNLAMPGSIVPIREPRQYEWKGGMAAYVEDCAGSFGSLRREGMNWSGYAEGRLKIMFTVTSEGKMKDIYIMERPMSYWELHSEEGVTYRKMGWAGDWRPALLDGKPVEVRVVTEFNYDVLDEMCWNYYLVKQ